MFRNVLCQEGSDILVGELCGCRRCCSAAVVGRGLAGVGVTVFLDGGGRGTKDGLGRCDILRGFHGRHEWKRDESASFVQRGGCLGVAGRCDSSNQCLHARDHDQTEATQAIPPRESPIQVYKPGIYESIKAGE